MILNWKEDGNIHAKFGTQSLNPWIRAGRLLFVLVFMAFDVGLALYKYSVLEETTSTSYSGHGGGAIAGLIIGVFVLQNRKVEDWEQIFQWISFSLYTLSFCVLIMWEIVGSFTDPSWFPVQGDDPLFCNP